ncbi:hypothetical protein [Serratia liquefaciens]|uniref:hypothetical protein n=1 Tax=Serratia liquefaciens TaxID=614 RepID=UPI003802ACAD
MSDVGKKYFKDITGAASIDTLFVTDTFGGTSIDYSYKDLYVIFKLRDSAGKLINVESSKLKNAVSEGCLKLMKFIGAGDLTISLTEENPGEKNFILKSSYINEGTHHHIMVFSVGSLEERVAVSAVIELTEGEFYSTSLISKNYEEVFKPSFVIFDKKN